MGSANRAGWIEAAVVTALSGALNWFGNGLNPVWQLMWFAVLPVLWFSMRSSRWSRSLCLSSNFNAGLVFRDMD